MRRVEWLETAMTKWAKSSAISNAWADEDGLPLMAARCIAGTEDIEIKEPFRVQTLDPTIVNRENQSDR